jgi:hypothetical protein
MIRTWSGVISYLDLMCCGFGGALLLLLIVSVCQPQPSAGASGRLMIVRAYTSGGPLPEIRMSCRRPHRSEWETVETLQTEFGDRLFSFQAEPMPGSGGESVWAIQDPDEGSWEFRVNLITFARGSPATPVRIELSAQGEGITFAEDVVQGVPMDSAPVAILQSQNKRNNLLWPGDFTKPIHVWVQILQAEKAAP